MRVTTWLASMLALLVSSAAFAKAPADSIAPPAPGKLIDIGGYRIHLWCTGKGGPTVVIVPGASEHSFNWAFVQPQIARNERVCTCDRGGEAWSDLGPQPRTKTQEAFNLRRALIAAGELGPYVLVGHSMGGDVVRLFAASYPEDVAGMVLVDSSTPDGMTNINGRIGTTRSFSRGREIPAPHEALAANDTLTAFGIARIREATRDDHPTIEPPFDKLPPTQQRWRLWALSQPKHFVSMNDEYIGEEAQRIDDENHRTPNPLANIPLVVLCRDTTVEKSHDPLHVVHQQQVAALSSRGEFKIVKGAGHHIHIDKPGAVVEAINKVAAEVRGDSKVGVKK
jgi:pimeloyl-ACP methyl ester carboxylesterase